MIKQKAFHMKTYSECLFQKGDEEGHKRHLQKDKNLQRSLPFIIIQEQGLIAGELKIPNLKLIKRNTFFFLHTVKFTYSTQFHKIQLRPRAQCNYKKEQTFKWTTSSLYEVGSKLCKELIILAEGIRQMLTAQGYEETSPMGRFLSYFSLWWCMVLSHGILYQPLSLMRYQARWATGLIWHGNPHVLITC